MTMNKVWDKLRKYNKANYRQFKFCIGFSVMLISSYLMMLFSPLVQNTLPIGGDSRKMIYMIFGIAAAGCVMFVLYTTGLFFRYKSRELGVFLALGSDKSKLTKAILVESAKLTAGCSAVGIVAGSLLSLILGKIFQMIASKANDNEFALTAMGLSYSLIYAVVIFVIVLVLLMVKMKRSNILEIMNQQRKQEPIKNRVTASYLYIGIVMLIAGIVIAFIIPPLVTRLTKHSLGVWTNLFYLIVLAGLYRVMTYSIASHRRGKNPQKYYNNVILYGMLKFQGQSVVRNMLVITLLIMGGLFAFFYVPMQASGTSYDSYEAGYSYRYPENADEFTETELRELAETYSVEVENYREGEFILLTGDGIFRDDFDENGNLIEEYAEVYAEYECISASEYEKLTGHSVEVKDGTYYMIMSSESHETIYDKYGAMQKLYIYDTMSSYPMEYAGNFEYKILKLGFGFGQEMRCVISDRDYALLRDGLPAEKIVKQVLFDTEENEQVLVFSNELYKQFALRMSDNMKVLEYYNAVSQELDGENYGYNDPAVYDPENSAKQADWKYEPILIYLNESNSILSLAVYFLMFLYVAVICMASVGIIAYTRSQSVGLGSKQVFDDLKKLGADNSYISRLLKAQVKKVYVLPTVVGCVVMIAFEWLLLYTNDGKISSQEIQTMIIATLLALGIVLYQYLLYRISLKKTASILELTA